MRSSYNIHIDCRDIKEHPYGASFDPLALFRFGAGRIITGPASRASLAALRHAVFSRMATSAARYSTIATHYRSLDAAAFLSFTGVEHGHLQSKAYMYSTARALPRASDNY